MKITNFEPKKLKSVNARLLADRKMINKKLSIFKKIKLLFAKN